MSEQSDLLKWFVEQQEKRRLFGNFQTNMQDGKIKNVKHEKTYLLDDIKRMRERDIKK